MACIVVVPMSYGIDRSGAQAILTCSAALEHILTESAPRPIQSISFNVCLSVVCLSFVRSVSDGTERAGELKSVLLELEN